MKTKEKLFCDWLFADEEYRKKHNSFTQMFFKSDNKWPVVNQPKFN